MIKISNSSQLLTQSKTAEVLSLSKDLERKGKKIIHFEAGQPDLPVPDVVLNSLKDNLSANTGYTIGRGLLELREEISNYYHNRFGTTIDPLSEVIITPGGKYGLFSSLTTLINPGDEIVITTPAWPTYFDLARFLKAKIKEVNLVRMISQL